MTDNVVKFSDVPPKWATPDDAKMLDWLIARGYLQHSQRHNWCAVEMAINKVIYEHGGGPVSKPVCPPFRPKLTCSRAA
jgi:hypothetical protein